MTTGGTLSVAIGGVLSGVGALRLFNGLWNAKRIARVLGDEFMVYADVGTFAVGPHAVQLKETKRLGVSLMMAALLLMSYEYYSNKVSLVWLIGLLVAAASLRLSTQMIPGCILVLGRSAKQTLMLQEAMNNLLSPFRAISLLRMSRSEDELALRAHSFRLGPGSDWAGAVQTLATFMPLLVLDLRDSSEYVEDEIRIVFQKDYIYKTIFVTPNGDKTPLLQRAAALGIPVADNRIACVSGSEDCMRLLRDVLFVRRMVPTSSTPIDQFHQ